MQGGPVQRGHEFALIDEADSVLIDEAYTELALRALHSAYGLDAA